MGFVYWGFVWIDTSRYIARYNLNNFWYDAWEPPYPPIPAPDYFQEADTEFLWGDSWRRDVHIYWNNGPYWLSIPAGAAGSPWKGDEITLKTAFSPDGYVCYVQGYRIILNPS